MPNEFKVKNGLVVDQGGANITGSSNISGSLGILASGSNVFTVDGTSGRLFSVDDSLSGSLFSVNTVAGLPIMEAFSDNTVRIGQYGQRALFVSQSNVGFGKEASIGAKVDVSGSVLVTGSLSVTSGITGSLFGTASWAQNAVTSSYTLTASFISGTVASASYALTASYAINAGGSTSAFPYTGSAIITGSINLIGSIFVTQSHISTVDYVDFTVDPGTPAHLEGRVHWNVDRKTLELDTDVNNFMINVGHMNVLRGRNTNPFTLTKGSVVYINGNSGQFATFTTASWEDDPRSAYTIGIIAQNINTNNYGYAVTDGEITGINTNGYSPSTLLYLSSSGQYTDVKPIAPNHTVRLGQVVVSSTSGIIQVKVDNGYETDELHDVLLQNTASGDLFVKSGSLWINSKQLTGSYGLTGSINITGSLRLSTPTYNTSSINVLTYNTANSIVEYSTINDLTFTKNIVNVGLSGSRGTRYNVIKNAVQSITDASENNTYTVRVYPGIYIEDTITVPSWVAIKGDSSISTVVSASNPSASIFVMSDQSMVIDMQIQGSTAPSASAVYYSSPTTPQRNAIAYVENVRFGTNYTNAKVVGSGSSGNCILQCSNVKYGGYTDATLQKSFDVGFYVTSGSSGGIGRMQLRNVTSTNGGVAGTDNNQIFALADAPGCTFIVNGCLLTRSTGTARGTAFKVYNGGQLRLTAVNFQRWINGIWAPQTGSAPSIDAIALNFENCTTDVLIEHTGSTGKVQGTDNFLKTQIALNAPLYEVGQDPRRITVGTKGADFTSISASVAYITDSSANNRYVIEVGPGQFTEKMIDLTGKPYVSIVGSNIQTTQIFPSSSTQHIIKMGINNEVSFLSLSGSGLGYSGLYIDDVGDFAQAHKVSIYNCDRGVTVNASTTDTQFYGEYIDINGTYSYGTYVSSSNGAYADVSMENYFLFPSASATIGNFVVGPSSSLGVRSAVFTGDGTAGSTAFELQDGAILEASSIDIPDWDTAVYVPNVGSGPTFRIVGTMIHNSATYDFNIQNSTTIGRFQGISDHSKINNVSEEFYWNFLDDVDGENDVTRKLSVTFADGTHTDATTLIFMGSSMGVLSGGEITISSSLTITTAAGYGYLHDPINMEVFKRFDWIDSNITLSPNTNNYIYIDSTGTLSAASTTPNFAQNIILGRVVTNDTGVEFIDQSSWNAEHTANRLSKFNREALGPVFAEGSVVTENVTPFKLNVTQGNYYFSENNFLPSGTSSINLNQYYISGSGWNRSTSSIVPNNVYASGSQLVPMSASYYTKHTVYLVGDGVDEEYFLVINGNQYASLVQAEGASLPTIPTYFNDGVVPLAAVYVQSGSANITQIEDIKPVIGFRAAGVNASAVHGNLLGLTADDHLQYFRVDGTREMTGDLGLGGNDIYNVSSVNASSFTGSLQGTASWANNAITSSYADNFTVAGTLIAQTIVVQTITSSTDFVTGSTRFGSLLTNTHQFTGSVLITGSILVNGNSVVTSNQTGSFVTNSQTGSYVQNSQTSSMTVATASFATSSLSSSYAVTASFAPLYVLNSVTASMLSPYVLSSQTSSFVTNSQTSSFVTNSQTSSFVQNSQTSSFLTNDKTGSFATTGSNRFVGNQVITGSLIVTQGITGSLFGTSSWSQNAVTASYVLNSVSASYAATAALAPNYVLISVTGSMLAPYMLSSNTSSFVTNSQTSSFVLNSQTSSFVLNSQTSSMTVATSSFATSSLSASYASNGGVTQIVAGTNVSISPINGLGSVTINAAAGAAFPFTGSALITGSLIVTGSTISTEGFIGSLFGTSSWAQNAITASFAPSYVLNTATSSFVLNSQTSSFVLNSQTSSFVTNAQTSSFVTNSQTSSFVTNAQTSSFVLNSQTSSFVQNSQTSSMTVLSASFATTSSYADNFTVKGTLTAQTIVVQTITSSTDYVTGSTRFGSLLSNTHQFTGSVSVTGSLLVNNNIVVTSNQTSSFVLNSQTSSFVVNSQTSSFATTGSNRFFGDQIITGSLILSSSAAVELTVIGNQAVTGSLIVTQGITGSLQGTSSWAINAITASYLLGGGSSAITIADEGTAQGTATFLNFIGTGVTATVSANTGSITITSGGGGLTTKAGSVANSSFTGNPKKATVTFSTAFPNTNYAITVTGEDARSWTVESKAVGSFIISANSNTALAGTTYWHAIAYGEA